MSTETTGIQGPGVGPSQLMYPTLQAACSSAVTTTAAPSAVTPSAPPEESKIAPSPLDLDGSDGKRSWLSFGWVTWAVYGRWSTKPEVEETAKRINELQEALAQSKSQMALLQSENGTLKGENGELKQRVTQWSQAFEIQKQTSESQASLLSEHSQKVTGLEKEKERLTLEKVALTDSLARTKLELDTIRKAKQEVSQGLDKAKIDDLKKQNAALTKTRDDQINEISNLRKVLAEKNVELDGLRAKVGSWDATCKKLEDIHQHIIETLEQEHLGFTELKVLLTELVAAKLTGRAGS